MHKLWYSRLKFSVIILSCLVFLTVVFNWQFFWQNIKFTFLENAANIPAPAAAAELSARPDFLFIPSLNLSAPVVYAAEAKEKAFQAALANGVAHYPGAAKPGEPGNVYIFGHSSDYVWSKGRFKTVFALLPRIKKGAEILVSDRSGKVFTYVVSESFSAKATDIKWLSQDTGGKKILSLQTSWPLGTALKRWIVRAEMVE